jgi:hypothetical protein
VLYGLSHDEVDSRAVLLRNRFSSYSAKGAVRKTRAIGADGKNRGIMSDVKKPKDTPKTVPAETKTVEAKVETSVPESKPDATPKKQGMGEGQKPVSKAYKDNWNDIFGPKKKR